MNAGIVTMGGGPYLAYAYCMIKLLRYLGCKLPVLFCYHGAKEEPPARVADDLDCDFLDIAPFNRSGWQAKAACCIASPFDHVIWNDSDAFWLSDGTWMLDSPEYVKHGVLFWKDDNHNIPNNEDLWRYAGVPYRIIEWPAAGTIFIDRTKHEDALRKVDTIMSHPAWRYVEDNDRSAWYMGWLGTGRELHRLPNNRVDLARAMIYHDLKGQPWIYHITSRAKNSVKLAFSVKAHPNCEAVRGFIRNLDRLRRGMPTAP